MSCLQATFSSRKGDELYHRWRRSKLVAASSFPHAGAGTGKATQSCRVQIRPTPYARACCGQKCYLLPSLRSAAGDQQPQEGRRWDWDHDQVSSVFSVSSWSLDISHRLEKQTNTSSLPATLTYRIPLRFKCENIFKPRCVSRTHHVRSFMPREMWLLWHLLPDPSCGTSQGFEDRNTYSASQIMKLQRTSPS